jgi:hypothetical protein
MSSRRKLADGKPASIVITEDKFSVHFHGARPLILAAVKRVGCPFHWNPRTAAYSVPKAQADRVCVAIETGTPAGRIKDRGLF